MDMQIAEGTIGVSDQGFGLVFQVAKRRAFWDRQIGCAECNNERLRWCELQERRWTSAGLCLARNIFCEAL